MVDLTRVRWLVVGLAGWLTRQQAEAVAYLVEENRTLRGQLGARRLSLTDVQRRRLAVLGYRLGCARLRAIATIVTPDTILRWHRQLVARKWTHPRRRAGRAGVLREIQQLVVRMATDNPSWGYTRIQGALAHVGHRVGRSTIGRILKAHGLPPVPERPTSWQTFLQAHWGAIAGADFFTTEVWTWRGLVTYYTIVVIDLASRRIQIVGATPQPDDAFMHQVGRQLTLADDGALAHRRVLICDRDTKWSPSVRGLLTDAGIRVVQTPYQAPNANAHAERVVRSIKEECLARVSPLGEGHFRRILTEFVAHYHGERPHQGLGNVLIDRAVPMRHHGRIRCRQRLGGLPATTIGRPDAGTGRLSFGTLRPRSAPRSPSRGNARSIAEEQSPSR